MTGSTTQVLRFPKPTSETDPVVITGIGIASSLGCGQKDVWREIQRGTRGVRLTCESDGFGGLRLPTAMIDWIEDHPTDNSYRSGASLKSLRLSQLVAKEALADAAIDFSSVDRGRIATSISAQFGDIGYTRMPIDQRNNPADGPHSDWFKEFLPCSASSIIGRQFGLQGPRLCHTTACASGLVSLITGARLVLDNQADFALCGATDAVTDLTMAAFNRMGVIGSSDDPAKACRPFDVNRNGFVIGEGGAMMVLERRSHALSRGATIYAEITASQTLCQAHHVTGLDDDADTLSHLITRLVHKAGWMRNGPQYISAHGTGTEQNDRSEMLAIRRSLGDRADDVVISSNKAVIGHMINAAGSFELALAALAMRDGYAPPTMNTTEPERFGNLDCLVGEGKRHAMQRVMKLSLAFGGHLVGIALSKPQTGSRAACELVHDALVRGYHARERTVEIVESMKAAA